MTDAATSTPTLSQSEQDYAAAQEAHGAATQALNDARADASNLRAQARTDPTVTGAAVAAADAEIELAEMREAVAREALLSQQDVLRQAAAFDAAQAYDRAAPAALDDVRSALREVRDATDRFLGTVQAHNSLNLSVSSAGNEYGSEVPGSPLQLIPMGATGGAKLQVNGKRIDSITARDWLMLIAYSAIGQPQNFQMQATQLYPPTMEADA